MYGKRVGLVLLDRAVQLKITRPVAALSGAVAPEILLSFLCCSAIWGAEPAPELVTVCEVLGNLPAFEAKTVAVLGRYSSRRTGRRLSENDCDQKLTAEASASPHELWLIENPQSAPKPFHGLRSTGPPCSGN